MAILLRRPTRNAPEDTAFAIATIIPDQPDCSVVSDVFVMDSAIYPGPVYWGVDDV